MFTTLTVLVASAVAAQAASSASASASASPASSTANPYIPTSISNSCQTYLTQMNADTDLAQCTSALVAATSGYGPGGSVTSASKSQISSTLSTVCSAGITSNCPQSLITGKLANFYTECGPELTTSPNEQVKTIYDIMFVTLPLLSAVCSKDDTGAWCLSSVNTSSTDSTLSPAVKLSRRADSVTAYMPNATTIAQNNIPFLFLSAALSKDELCTTCTRNILSSYMSFESGTNYAPGLAQSVLIPGQTALYSAVVSKCGTDFLSGAVKAAGGLGQGSSGSSGSSGALSLRAGSVLAMLVGSLGLAVLLL